jgi:hypothetical protein
MTDTTTNPSPRHRGAPLGNHNALRHGFYAKNLGQSSPAQYSEPLMRNLLGEAAMLKDYMYNLYCKNLESDDPAVIADTLRILSLAGISLSRILQTHSNIRVYSSERTTSLEEILSALDEAAANDNQA